MGIKQISLTVPDVLFKESSEYCESLGYKNLQEFILDLIRKRVFLDKIERYKQIEEEMKKGKNVKRMSQKEAINFIKNL